MVLNPKGLARMNTPSIHNLRKIARRTHFVSRNGTVEKFPDTVRKPNNTNAKISNIVDHDTQDTDSDMNIMKFLESRGLLATT